MVWLFLETARPRAVRVSVIVKFLERRVRAFLGKLDAVERDLFGAFVELIELFVRQFAFARELSAQTRDRIVESVLFQFFLGPVTGGIGHGVASVPISARLHKCRMRLFANRSGDLSQFIAHFAKVHSIDNFAGNVITLGPIDNLFQRCRSFHGCAHGKEVVFANEDNRQLVKRGQIERFMKSSLVDRAIAKKTKRNPIFISIFAREGQSGREWNMRADNGVPTVHVILAIEEMHRAAETARAAGFFAEEFGHAGLGTGSARERVGMIAVRGDDVVVTSRRRDRTTDDGFLADVKMAEAADFLSLILLTGAFFKTPDQQHQREHLDFVALLGQHCTHAARGSAFARERSAPRSKLRQKTKSRVKKRSLRSELRKNIQLGVALYCGRPTVSA